MKVKINQPFAALCLLLVSGAATAHSGHDPAGGFASGFGHPVNGLDHLAAMLAVGMWSALAAGRRAWIPVVTFMACMTLGAVLGMNDVALAGIESGIAASLLVMGLLLASLARVPMAVAAALVGSFAVFHGHAHGAEMPGAVSPFLYGLGFLLATGALHLAGIAIGNGARRFRVEWTLRGAGMLVGSLGAWLLYSA